MHKYNPKNERIKRDYFRFKLEADQKSEATVRGHAKAIARFEEHTYFLDFGKFNSKHAVSFKLSMLEGGPNKKPLSKSTILSTTKILQQFFWWLSRQPRYKSKITQTDIAYFNLSEKDIRAAKAPKPKDYPSLEQFRRALFAMPTETEMERRDQAVMALAIMTGARDSAMISLRLKHVDLERKLLMQDPNEVQTKFSKRIDTFFFPVGEDIEVIIINWVKYLTEDRLFGPNDPLFPKTTNQHDPEREFVQTGVEPSFWANASPVRAIFKRAFMAVDLPYFSPHRVRDTLVHIGQKQCLSAESWKAWSQNLGHESMLTTWASYGQLTLDRQGELIRSTLAKMSADSKLDRLLELAEAPRH